MKEVVIVSGARTAVGAFGGGLKGVKAVDLGALVIKEAVKRAGLRPAITDEIKSFRPNVFGDFDKTEINKKYYDYDASLKPVYFDELIMGQGLIAGMGQNPGRQAGIFAGLPEETNAITVNKVCASGIKSVALAAPVHQGRGCGSLHRGRHGKHEQRHLRAARCPLGFQDEHALRPDLRPDGL